MPRMLRPVSGLENLDGIRELPVASLVPHDPADRVGIRAQNSAHQGHPAAGVASDSRALEKTVPQRQINLLRIFTGVADLQARQEAEAPGQEAGHGLRRTSQDLD